MMCQTPGFLLDQLLQADYHLAEITSFSRIFLYQSPSIIADIKENTTKKK